MNPKSVCRYNKFGYCRFSDKCHFRHDDVLCSDKNCDVFKCEKRHPKICTYQRDFGRCKFTTYCRYNHEKQINVRENSEKIRSVEKKLQEVEKKQVKNNSSEKIETIEKKIIDIAKTIIYEKDITNKLEAMEKIYQSDIEMLKEQLKKMVTCEVYRCSDCKTKFSTVSDIKKHINKDHKGRNVCLTHLKTNRDHFDFIDDNFYTSREFFKK